MKKMKIEKQLIFADHVKRLLSLQVQEGLTYRHEEEGIRAIGPLYIKGEYEGDDGVERFQETLEMDVLAPKDKLAGDDFRLSIGQYHGKEQEDSIQIMVSLDIHGLKEDKEKDKAVDTTAIPDMTHAQSAIAPTSSFKAKEEQKENHIDMQSEESTSESVKADHDTAVSQPVIDSFDDLFADAQSTYTSYRIIVAKPNDTYTAIANRYEVDEEALRNTNQNKEILAKTLVILPFARS